MLSACIVLEDGSVWNRKRDNHNISGNLCCQRLPETSPPKWIRKRKRGDTRKNKRPSAFYHIFAGSVSSSPGFHLRTWGPGGLFWPFQLCWEKWWPAMATRSDVQALTGCNRVCRKLSFLSHTPGLPSSQTTRHLNLAFSHQVLGLSSGLSRNRAVVRAKPTDPLETGHSFAGCAGHWVCLWWGRCRGKAAKVCLPVPRCLPFSYPSWLQRVLLKMKLLISDASKTE